MSTSSLSGLRKQAEAAGTMTGGGKLLPAGTYQAEVVKSSAVTNAAGKQQFKLQFKVLVGPEAGSTVWETITISPESDKALGIAFAALSALGADAAIERDESADAIASVILGATAEIVTYVEEWGGVDRAKVRFVNRSSVVGDTTPSVTSTTASGKPVF